MYLSYPSDFSLPPPPSQLQGNVTSWINMDSEVTQTQIQLALPLTSCVTLDKLLTSLGLNLLISKMELLILQGGLLWGLNEVMDDHDWHTVGTLGNRKKFFIWSIFLHFCSMWNCGMTFSLQYLFKHHFSLISAFLPWATSCIILDKRYIHLELS